MVQKEMPSSEDEVKVGKTYEVMVTFSNTALSCPLSVSFSPKVSSKILFSRCAAPLAKVG